MASAVQELVLAASKPASGIWGTILSFILVLFGASGVFGELKDSLNIIWKAAPKEGNGIWMWIRGRFLSIGMVLGICFLLLVSLVLNAGLGVVGKYGMDLVPGAPIIMEIIGMCLTLFFVTTLFACMFKYLPDTRVSWKDVWIGSVVTAILFTLGKSGLEIYISRAGVASQYGAAGALALVLVWVYFSAQIFLMGAEFTQVYADEEGSRANATATGPVLGPELPPVPATLAVAAAASVAESPIETARKILGIENKKKLKPMEHAARMAGAGLVLAITRFFEKRGKKGAKS